MLSQKQAKEVREKLFADMVLDGFTVEGRTKEGLAFSDEEGNIIVVKIVAKKDDFDLVDAIEEFEEAQAKALEKEKKHAEKVDKAKEKKAKEEAKEKEKEEKEKRTRHGHDRSACGSGARHQQHRRGHVGRVRDQRR